MTEGVLKIARRIWEVGVASSPVIGRRRGAFSTLLRQSGLRASTGGVLATISERKMLASTRLCSLYAWLCLLMSVVGMVYMCVCVCVSERQRASTRRVARRSTHRRATAGRERSEHQQPSTGARHLDTTVRGHAGLLVTASDSRLGRREFDSRPPRLNTEMGDRLRTDKPPRYFTKPPRSTQPPTLRRTGNEYRPKCGDALRLRSKSRMAHSTRG